MFDLMKPGHVLRFTTCPTSIVSPLGVLIPDANDNSLETLWTGNSYLGMVQCLSHPSGSIGAAAAYVATHIRTTPDSRSRTVGYSAPGRLLTSSNRVVGAVDCDFVGYVDGRSNYIQSTRTVFSKDFSGCLMVEYRVAGQRRVAHVAASGSPPMNCKQPFLTTLQGMGAALTNGWFQPFVVADSGGKANRFVAIGKYLEKIDNLVTFGVVTATGNAYSVEAFKPDGVAGNDWVVTDITRKTMSGSWIAP